VSHAFPARGRLTGISWGKKISKIVAAPVLMVAEFRPWATACEVFYPMVNITDKLSASLST
jgi:hypothetical protein